MQENTESTIKNGQSSKTGNIGYTRRRETKQKHNTICVGHHYAQTKTIYVNKTCVLLTTGGKDEPNIAFFCGNRNGYPNIELTSVLTNSVILLDVHSALRILFPNYYPLVNEVAKGYGNAGFSVVFMNQVIPIHQVVSEKKMKM